MSAATSNTAANTEVLAKLFFYNLYDQLAAVAAATGNGGHQPPTAGADGTDGDSPSAAHSDAHQHHPHRLIAPHHQSSRHPQDPTNRDRSHSSADVLDRSPSSPPATDTTRSTTPGAPSDDHHHHQHHHQHHPQMEPPTPPRTPIQPGHHHSAAAVSAIMENIQQSFSQRIEQLAAAAAAAAATNHQRGSGIISPHHHPLISVTPAAKLMATGSAGRHRHRRPTVDSDSDAEGAGTRRSPSVDALRRQQRRGVRRTPDDHRPFDERDDDADEDYAGCFGDEDDADEADEADEEEEEEEAGSAGRNSAMRAFDMSFRCHNNNGMSSSHDDSNMSGEMTSGGGGGALGAKWPTAGDMTATATAASMNFLSATSSVSSAGSAFHPGAAADADKFNAAESSRYLSHYASYLECGHDRCTADNQREHYHCYDIICLGKVLAKKEEIIRHLKWHKKRNESLNHGFLRFSSSDDCTPQYSSCTHNRKQTHYHCLQPNCDKVYISTSDVQMHSNYHRKDSAIIQEGFQRFRATEECGAPEHCVFAGQRTTHFHCRRSGCQYTFKNKADMEKHKTYHIKDEQLSRDGFKKFLKTEQCPYERCRFSRICNHIHCVRDGCFYVLHSSGQLLSHKRKHDRIDSEQAYRRFKVAQQQTTTTAATAAPPPPPPSGSTVTSPAPPTAGPFEQLPADLSVSLLHHHRTPSGDERPSDAAVDLSAIYATASAGRTMPNELLAQIHQQQQLAQRRAAEAAERMDSQPKADATDASLGRILAPNRNQSYDENEAMLVRTYFTDACVADPRHRDAQRNVGPVFCHMFEVGTTHLHCLLRGCDAKGVRRTMAELTAHLREHQLQLAPGATVAMMPASMVTAVPRMVTGGQQQQQQQVTSIDGFFNRKRGRPPKNRVVEVYNNIQQSPQAIFTSFKLEKGASAELRHHHPAASPNIAAALQRAQPTLPQPIPKLHPQQPSLHSISSAVAAATVARSPSNRSPGDAHHHTPAEHKFHFLQPHETCPDGAGCRFAGLFHFHCTDAQRRCHFATNYAGDMDRHTTGFHASVKIRPHFEFFDRHANCGRPDCGATSTGSGAIDHFHCQLCDCSVIAPSEQLMHVCPVGAPTAAGDQPQPQPQQQFNNNNNNNINNNEYCSERSKSRGSGSEDGDDGRAGLTDNDVSGSSGRIGSVSGGVLGDDEKVLVVRAAGTYFPGGEPDSPSQSTALTVPGSANTSTESPKSTSSSADIGCLLPFCKLKKKPHVHCELCNQAFSEEGRLKTHYLKHQSSNLVHHMMLANKDHHLLADDAHTPQDLSVGGAAPTSGSPIPGQLCASSPPPPSSSLSAMADKLSPNAIDKMMTSPSFVDNFTLQNLHLAHLAFYQQNPYYYQNLYPFLSSQGVPINRADMLQAHIDHQALLSAQQQQQQQHLGMSSAAVAAAAGLDLSAGMPSEILLAMAAASAVKPDPDLSDHHHQPLAKRPKLSRSSGGTGSGSGSAAPSGTANASFKMFKDEPIPQGYLKFRFNEDCQFANCGYRNHQSHFHCCRTDCYYSFCDKTRFVQHTARHERLDKLMGDDFKQFRANMRCGYEECAYNKNMGANNKSSHFHCMKCSFICSDTNKVVAHRRQHSKLEYIRMAGFRKVANNEPCLTTESEVAASASENNHSAINHQPASPASSTSSQQPPQASSTPNSSGGGGGGTGGALVECNYSLKQTHYHCLVCNCSVLSRAQLGSHRHRV